MTVYASLRLFSKAQGFHGQSYDFHGVAGGIYHILSDHPDFAPRNQPRFSVNGRVDQAYTTSLTSDSVGQIKSYTAKEDTTWLTDIGIQYASDCIEISAKSAMGFGAAAPEFAIAHGSIQVSGQQIVRTGSYDFGGTSAPRALECMRMCALATATF